ncbi:MAG: MBL fold metallo-hydrolase, partial [Promethearchaeota archaeon]
LYEVVPDIYATIEKEDMNVGSNAGFFDLGDQLIIFDTFLNIKAAKDLKQAAMEITGKTASMIVISHFHTDHIIGLPVFMSDEDHKPMVVTAPYTQDIIERELEADIKEIHELPESKMQEFRDQLRNATTESERLNAENTLRFYDNIRNPEVKAVIPNLTITDKLIIHGTKHTVELINVGTAHTTEDIIAYFSAEKIVFMGDLLFSNRDPWIGSGDPKKWVEFMDEFSKNDIESYIPGHGSIATKVELKLQTKYIRELMDLVIQGKQESGSEPTIITRTMLSEDFYKWNSPCYEWNSNFLNTAYWEKLKN